DHPPYSPDLAPSNFRLFPKLKQHLCGKKFSSSNEVVQSVKQWFAEVGQPFFQEAVEILEHRWDRCINLLGKMRILSDKLNMRWIAAKFVPRLLSDEQKQHHVQICTELQERLVSDPDFLSKVITGDESWVCGYSPETSSSLLNGRVHRHPVLRKPGK
ncbi:hypothetical protein ANN_24760, partial [Periplaneta americana]